jgi:hypothetical protein
VRLVVRVAKVLDLRLRELPHPQQARPWVDLVAVGLADLGGRKGQAPAVEVQEVFEVDENALGRLRAEVADRVAARADGGLEHEVEGVRLGQGVARVGRDD